MSGHDSEFSHKNIILTDNRNSLRLRRAQFIQAFLFCAALVTVGILSLTLPKPTQSAVEKRKLAELPKFSKDALFEGSYTKDLELYYADTFPFRENFVSLAAVINELRGIRYDDVRIYNQTSEKPIAPPPPETSSENVSPAVTEIAPEAAAVAQPETKPAAEPDTEIDNEVGERNGAVFVYKNQAMSIFGGSSGMAEWYAGTINAYNNAWGSGVQIYNIVIPSAIEFALPARYKDITVPEKPNIEHIYSSLNSEVIGVDAYSEIAAHTGEYLYFNADHHWTGLGAYYAYRAFAKSAGLTPLELTDYEKRTITGFRGTMYASTNDTKLADDYVDYFIPSVEYSAVRYDKNAPYAPQYHTIWADYASGGNAYSVFLHGDFPLIKIDTNADNGRKILVVKESFGNAFAPFLISHYDEVHIVDQRYFQLGLIDYVKKNGIQEVIFINNSFAANTAIRISEISGLMYQDYQPPTTAPPIPEQTVAEEEISSDRPQDSENQ